jgi:hypothetical protein
MCPVELKSHLKDPLSVLGLSGPFNLADINHAYRERKFRNIKEGKQDIFSQGDQESQRELEWAYKEAIAQMEELSNTDEEGALSAALLPGISADDLVDICRENVLYLNRKNEGSASERPLAMDRAFENVALHDIISLTENLLANYKSRPEHASSVTSTLTRNRPFKLVISGIEKDPVKVCSPNASDPTNAKKLKHLIQTAEQVSGALLRKLREEIGVTVEELHTRTRIPKKFIEDLETDCYDYLPAVPYVRGYLVAYLRYLGIEKGDLVDAITENYRARLRMRARAAHRQNGT